MSGVAGLRGSGSGDLGTDQRPKNFRDMLLMVGPAGVAPVFALTSRASTKSVDDPEFNWWDEPQGHVRLLVNGALGTGDTTITVDSADPTATTMTAQYGTATHLKPGDLLYVETGEVAAFSNERIEVTSVISDTQFTAKRGVAGTTAAAISDNDLLTLVGSAFAEGTGAPDAVSRNPIKFQNFTQIFKDTYELTGTLDKTRLRTGDEWSNDKRRKTFDHSRGIEMALLFGKKNESTGANGKPLRYMGGLRSFIPTAAPSAGGRTRIYAAAVTVFNLIDDISPCFDYASPGGDTRIAFCGNQALIELNKIVQADANSEIQYGGIVKVFGMDFRELMMPQGRLLIKTHPLMSLHAVFKQSMFIIDFSVLKYVFLRGRDTKAKDDVQNPDEDLRRGFYQTECSLMVDFGGLTCGYLGNISQT